MGKKTWLMRGGGTSAGRTMGECRLVEYVVGGELVVGCDVRGVAAVDHAV